ncbi:MAG: DNA repair and recombination protein RadA [Candidatus Heimdallarchaeota archaeon]|nr:DNA repair and recombination protein RadA [Candidatus Heimdallarchaeota archaeon]
MGAKSAQILIEAGISTPAALMQAKLTTLEEAGLTRTMSKKLREGVITLFPDIYGNFVEEKSLEDIEGIGPTTAKSLREKGMNIHLLETTPVKELEERFGITQNSAIKYQSAIADSHGGYFTSALAVMEKQKVSNTFTFGAESLDNLFFIPELGKGGVREGETYEFFGSFRSGKSQLCHQLCVSVQLPKEMGGLGKKAIYIDTEGTFSPTRISQMGNRMIEEKGWNKSLNDILSDVMYARAKNSDMQQGVAMKLLEILGEHPDEYGLVIVDSVTAHFRAEYAGRGTLADRQQTLNHHLSVLHRIADTYNLAIVVTNQVQANPAQFFGDPTTAVGGNIMGHWAQTRCYLRKSKGEKRVIRIYDSPVLGENEAVFEITGNGILTSE